MWKIDKSFQESIIFDSGESTSFKKYNCSIASTVHRPDDCSHHSLTFHSLSLAAFIIICREVPTDRRGMNESNRIIVVTIHHSFFELDIVNRRLEFLQLKNSFLITPPYCRLLYNIMYATACFRIPHHRQHSALRALWNADTSSELTLQVN
jgi:hypothetical protein